MNEADNEAKNEAFTKNELFDLFKRLRDAGMLFWHADIGELSATITLTASMPVLEEYPPSMSVNVQCDGPFGSCYPEGYKCKNVDFQLTQDELNQLEIPQEALADLALCVQANHARNASRSLKENAYSKAESWARDTRCYASFLGNEANAVEWMFKRAQQNPEAGEFEEDENDKTVTAKDVQAAQGKAAEAQAIADAAEARRVSVARDVIARAAKLPAVRVNEIL